MSWSLTMVESVCCLLKVEVGAAEGDRPTLEAWVNDVNENLLGSHQCDVRWAMIGHQNICCSRAVGHIDQRLGQFDVIL